MSYFAGQQIPSARYVLQVKEHLFYPFLFRICIQNSVHFCLCKLWLHRGTSAIKQQNTATFRYSKQGICQHKHVQICFAATHVSTAWIHRLYYVQSLTTQAQAQFQVSLSRSDSYSTKWHRERFFSEQFSSVSILCNFSHMLLYSHFIHLPLLLHSCSN
jgi:hypothetical protein